MGSLLLLYDISENFILAINMVFLVGLVMPLCVDIKDIDEVRRALELIR